MRHGYLLPVAAVVFAAGLAGSALAENMIETGDVKVEGNTLTFSKVMSDVDGFLVIHAVEDGQVVAPASVAHTPISAGENEMVSVELPETPAPGTEFVAMLHTDTGEIGTYEFGPGMTDEDKPVMQDGQAVVSRFAIE